MNYKVNGHNKKYSGTPLQVAVRFLKQASKQAAVKVLTISPKISKLGIGLNGKAKSNLQNPKPKN